MSTDDTEPMDSMPPDSDHPAPVTSSLRNSTWTTPVVVVGLLGILAWRSAAWLDRDWLASMPVWLVLTVTGVIPCLLLLIYPLLTRRQPRPNRFRLPSLRCIVVEAALAIPIVFGCILLVGVLQLVATQLSPETSLTPKVYEHMAGSTGTPLIYGFLLVAFLYAPIAEEVFFRGFLFNAFRGRMPLVVAMLLQSAVFGFVHFYSWAPALAVALLGLTFTLVYYWRRTIIAPIFVHAGYNSLMVAVLLLAMHANAAGPALGVGCQQAPQACTIETIVPGSPAESAGLLPGDTITHVDDYEIADFQDLRAAIACFEVGDTVVVTADRKGFAMQFEVAFVRRSELSP